MPQKAVAVTGAVGFIGGHCCERFLSDGWEVRGLDNFDPFYSAAIKRRTLSLLKRLPGFRFHEGDIREPSHLQEFLRGADLVVHLAARAGVQPSIAEPALYSSVNVEGTACLLEACRNAGIRRVVFGSSSSVYGDTTPVPFREDAPALDPISPYAATKRAGELLCSTYSTLHDFRIAALRFFTVYGPRQRPDLAIHKFTRLLSSGTPVEQYGEATSERDYTHVEDILGGIRGAMRWVEQEGPAFEIFNLGESRTVRLDRLITLIAAALGVEPIIHQVAARKGDVRRTYADVSKARRMLGYAPRVTIEDGIVDFVRWYQASRNTDSEVPPTGGS
jgi:UDP-glucuronate 4-epimerase